MSFSFRNFTLSHYLRHVRKQSKHVQHIHAFVFAGAITGLIAFFILYTDYGFFHETYVASEPVQQEGVSFDPESPSESIGRFWQEAKERFGEATSGGDGLFTGKETYIKEE